MEIKDEEGDKTRCLAQVGGGAESQLRSIRDNDYCGGDDDHICIMMIADLTFLSGVSA